MKPHKATAGDKLTAVYAMRSQAIKHTDKPQPRVLAVSQRSVPTRNINIHWNQNGCHEQSKHHMKRTATMVQSGKDAKQDEDKKGSRCGETKHEEQDRDANNYRDLNKT
ncbi:MAG: hypothetical protein AAB370_05690 [Verrucomicrobiota bacterium]